MGTKPILPGELDAALAEVLVRELSVRGWSQSELARRTGISQPRVHRMLAVTRPMTVDDLDDMCAELGLVTWRVVKEAETSLSGALPTIDPEALGLAANDDERDRDMD